MGDGWGRYNQSGYCPGAAPAFWFKAGRDLFLRGQLKQEFGEG